MTDSTPRLEPVLVADDGRLRELIAGLAGEPAVALDTESNSFHVYRERVCLVQLSTRASDYVIDPFAVDLRLIGQALAAVPTLVLHGADYDVRCLKRAYGMRLTGLFDTMAAARRLGRPGLGLSALVERHFGARLSKDFQRSDWGRRPLSAEQVRYAALDTHFLLPLHDLLARELREGGHEEEAQREFERIAAAEPRPKIFDPEGWRHLRGARQLDSARTRAAEEPLDRQGSACRCARPASLQGHARERPPGGGAPPAQLRGGAAPRPRAHHRGDEAHGRCVPGPPARRRGGAAGSRLTIEDQI